MSVLKVNQIQTANGVIMANLNSSGVNIGFQLASNLAPAFRAYLSASTQTITSGSNQKATFDQEVFDTLNCFNNTGSTVGSNPAYSFLPTVAGYYQFNACTLFNNIASGVITICEIWKNGNAVARGNSGYISNTNGDIQQNISTILYANGTTDYFNVYVYQNSGSSKTLYNAEALTNFNGCFIRSA
jgi:hypothetical protein